MKSPSQGQIYRMKQDAVGKQRPVLIMSRQQLNGGHYVVAVPFTTQQIDRNVGRENYVLFEAGEAGLEERSLAKCSDISLLRIADLQMSAGPIGVVDAQKLLLVKEAIRWSLDLGQ